MDPSRFKDISSQFESRSILVVGDLMLDAYMWGRAERISPEAPVPVIQVDRVEHNPGGAGNVALNVVGLSAQVFIAGIIGNDAEGTLLGQLLAEREVSTDGLIVDVERPTTIKTRVIAHNQQVVRTDREHPEPLNGALVKKLVSAVETLLPRIDAVILEDYNKGSLTGDGIEKILQSAASLSIPVYVDPKRNHFYDYKGVRLFKPNHDEFQSALAGEYKADRFIELGLAMRNVLEADILLVTRGAEGVSVFTQEGHESITTKARRVHDVSGAGDTFIATFVLSDLCGASPRESAILANYAAGRVCEEVGVVPVTLEMVRDIIDHHAAN